MSHIDMPMNTAHQHAANADDHLAQGLLIPAAEEHYKAAEAYMAAVERSNDESAKRTLRMLYNEHCKAGKELQRKIAKLKEEGKDPTLPQKSESSSQSVAVQSPSPAQQGILPHVPSPPPHRRMTDSQNTVDESFMLLGGQRSDPGDAFNQFWNIMQGMLDNLSQPVAFATVPLGSEAATTSVDGADSPSALRKDGSSSSDATDVEELIVKRFTRRIGISGGGKEITRPVVSNSSLGISSSKQNVLLNESDDDIFDEGDDLSESFYLIPSGDEPPAANLKKENAHLKIQVETLQKRLEAMERALQLRKEQDQQLRDSIFLATREAQRVMGASVVIQRPGIDFGSSNLNNVSPMPIPGINTGREAQYIRRVRDLEDELRAIRVENEKNKTMISKYRERWDKLKESAKRKKEAKVVAEIARLSVRERIDEEPEAEAALAERM